MWWCMQANMIVCCCRLPCAIRTYSMPVASKPQHSHLPRPVSLHRTQLSTSQAPPTSTRAPRPSATSAPHRRAIMWWCCWARPPPPPLLFPSPVPPLCHNGLPPSCLSSFLLPEHAALIYTLVPGWPTEHFSYYVPVHYWSRAATLGVGWRCSHPSPPRTGCCTRWARCGPRACMEC
jgi:hypothetical protein